MNKEDLKTEQLPDEAKSEYISTLMKQMDSNDNLTREEHMEKLEIILIERAKCECDLPERNSKCRCFSAENLFILAQFYFDCGKIKKAYQIFDSIKFEHKPSMYQLAVILYDELITEEDSQLLFSDTQSSDDNVTQKSSHGERHDNSKKGFAYMLKLAQSVNAEEHEQSMIHSAQYNVGAAYFQGFSVRQSNREAERWWLLAANDGDPKGCIKAMGTLAFFYSQPNDPENFDMKKAYFWHNEACGNGCLESQGNLFNFLIKKVQVKI